MSGASFPSASWCPPGCPYERIWSSSLRRANEAEAETPELARTASHLAYGAAPCNEGRRRSAWA